MRSSRRPLGALVAGLALVAVACATASEEPSMPEATAEGDLTARALAGQELRALSPSAPYRVLTFASKDGALAYDAENRSTGELEHGVATVAGARLALAHGAVTEEYVVAATADGVTLTPAGSDLAFAFAKARAVTPPWPGVMLPSGHERMVRLEDGRLFAFSVHPNPSDSRVDEVSGFEFDTKEGVWNPIPSLPRGIRFGGSVRHLATRDGRVVFASSFAFGAGPALVELDTKTMTWSSQYVVARLGYAVGACPDGNVLALGGILRDERSGYPWIPEGIGSKWHSVPLPKGRLHAVLDAQTVSTAEGLVYVPGGTLGEDHPWEGKMRGTPIPTVAVYDCAKNEFRYVAPMKEPRAGHAASLGPDGRIHVFGGGRAAGPFGEVYDPRTDTWSDLPASPLPSAGDLVPGPDGTLC